MSDSGEPAALSGKAHGAHLTLSGCEVELSREGLVLDVRVSHVESDVESIVVSVEGQEVASIPARFVRP